MPHRKGAAGRGMGATNGTLRKEIKQDILDNLKVADISRTSNDISKGRSANFHTDSVELSNGSFKVEIQYRSGTKKTVAVAEVAPGSSDASLRAGLFESLKDGFKYMVS